MDLWTARVQLTTGLRKLLDLSANKAMQCLANARGFGLKLGLPSEELLSKSMRHGLA